MPWLASQARPTRPQSHGTAQPAIRNSTAPAPPAPARSPSPVAPASPRALPQGPLILRRSPSGRAWMEGRSTPQSPAAVRPHQPRVQRAPSPASTHFPPVPRSCGDDPARPTRAGRLPPSRKELSRCSGDGMASGVPLAASVPGRRTLPANLSASLQCSHLPATIPTSLRHRRASRPGLIVAVDRFAVTMPSPSGSLRPTLHAVSRAG